MGSESSSSRNKSRHSSQEVEDHFSDNESNKSGQFVVYTNSEGVEKLSSDEVISRFDVVTHTTNDSGSNSEIDTLHDTKTGVGFDKGFVDSSNLEKLTDEMCNLSTSQGCKKFDQRVSYDNPESAKSTAKVTESESLGYSLKPPNSSENACSSDLNDFIHHVKWIRFHDENLPIITQNQNGPCPMIAIINVLLLRGAISLPKETEMISGDRILTILSDHLLSMTPKHFDRESLLNYESTVYDALSLFPSLQTGLDVNVRFTGISDFEYTSALSIFDLFNIQIYHGWLVDPEEEELNSVIGLRTYNQMVEELVRLRTSTIPDDSYKCLLVESFFEQSASQLTFHGLFRLCSTLRDQQLAVLFRNNHFSTVLKRGNSILVLVTDMGLLDEPNIVWEVLNDLDGDTQFVDSNFQLYRPPTAQKSTDEPAFPNQHISATDKIITIPAKSDKRQFNCSADACKVDDTMPGTNSHCYSVEFDYELSKKLQEEEIRASKVNSKLNCSLSK